MNKIMITFDEDGNVSTDITGLIHLLKTKQVSPGAFVYMVDNADDIFGIYTVLKSAGLNQEMTYTLGVAKTTDALTDTFKSALKNKYHHDDSFHLDSTSLTATFMIDGEFILLEKDGYSEQAIRAFVSIHYEEALTRMKNGESVYLKATDEAFNECTKETPLTPTMVMDGDWFRLDGEEPPAKPQTPTLRQTRNVPELNKQKRATAPKPPLGKKRDQLTKTDRQLMAFLDMTEADYLRIKQEIDDTEQDINHFNYEDESVEANIEEIIASLPKELSDDIILMFYEAGLLEVVPIDDGDDVEGYDFLIEEDFDDDDFI